MRTVPVLLLLTVLGCLGSCRGQPRARPVATAADSTFNLSVGDTFSVTLPGLIGSGYQWQLVENDACPVRLDSSAYHQPETAVGKPPALGERDQGERFYLSARRPGSCELTFLLLRPFGPPEPVDSARYAIRVEE